MAALPSLHAQVVAQVGALRLELDLALGAETVALVGPNGSGKTSLLKVLLGALPLAEGHITLHERVLAEPKRGLYVPLEERHIGYVPQEYGLFPHMSAEQHLEFALTSRGPTTHSAATHSATTNTAKSARQAQIATTLENLDLYRIRHCRPKELSGGERQRLALGRALIAEPKALLLDEPLAALDVVSRHDVREFLRAYLARLALPTLFITHDAQDARAFAQRILVLEHGKIVQQGTWHELEHHPASAFVAWFTKAG